jgi:hypothetical protein
MFERPLRGFESGGQRGDAVPLHLVEGAQQVPEDGVVRSGGERFVGEPIFGDYGRGGAAAPPNDSVVIEQESAVAIGAAFLVVLADNLLEVFVHVGMYVGGAEGAWYVRRASD